MGGLSLPSLSRVDPFISVVVVRLRFEYALILAVLTVVMIFCMRLLGARIIIIFSDIAAILDTAQSSH